MTLATLSFLAELCGNWCYWRARSCVQGSTAGEQRCEFMAGKIEVCVCVWGGEECPPEDLCPCVNSRQAEWKPEFRRVLSEIGQASMVA